MGFPVATFGYPINKIEDGVRRLSQKTLSGFISETRDDDGVLKLVVDALFHPGLSGGPLISLMSGDVIGVIHKRQKYEEYDGFGERLFPAHFSEASVTTSSPKYTDIGAELEDLDISFCHRSY